MILDDLNLKGKTAIVTGCSDLQGLGYGIAEGLAEAGADIVGVARSDMSKTKKSIETKTNSKFLEVNKDLQDLENISKIIDITLKEFGNIDILVNNAGIIRRDPILEFSEKDWDDVLNLNLKAVFKFSQKVAREFVKKDKKGKIINIASMLTYQGGVFVPSYTASKHGVAGITKSLCNELASKGINVNAIAPGYMITNNTKALRNDEKRNKAILARIPADRWGKNSDLKGAAVFLASSASDYVNGAIIPVDGGWLSR